MKPRIGDIMFDAADPVVMATFWAGVMGYDVQEADETWAAIVDPEGKAPRFCFQKLLTPKVHKNRIHFDLFVADMEGEVERIVALGATKVRVGQEDVVWTVMTDPEGNEFCVQPEM